MDYRIPLVIAVLLSIITSGAISSVLYPYPYVESILGPASVMLVFLAVFAIANAIDKQ